MAKRKKKVADSGKNRKLDELLRGLKIEGEKRDKIVAFVEELTFKRMKELSTGVTEEKENEKKKLKLRLRMPWTK
ncbi:hypothetical protein HYV85_01500 [Candidatus Woesearchaeota archaeon]|nr:hypothetical protein [Candidatus Woesearchaeota archaeon]